MRTKKQRLGHTLHKQRSCKCYKVYEDYIEFETEQGKNVKRAERRKTIFSKESVENADFRKPVLNKVMTTHK